MLNTGGGRKNMEEVTRQINDTEIEDEVHNEESQDDISHRFEDNMGHTSLKRSERTRPDS